MRNVLAVVITYFPDFEMLEMNLRAVGKQARDVLVVNNGTDNADRIKSLANACGASFMQLPDNLGLGRALNIGVAHAIANTFEWVLTMDQDSVIDDAFIESYFEHIESTPNVVCLTPNFGRTALSGKPCLVNTAITSGNLVKLSVIEDLGGYDEDLFIDNVDFDFTYRLRANGHSIYFVPTAKMKHCLGEELQGDEAGKSRFYIRHSPFRRYYIVRNSLYLIARYFRGFPLEMFKFGLATFISMVQVLLKESCRGTNIKYMYHGIRDYIAGVKGRGVF